MESVAASVASKTQRKLGTAVTYDGGTIYAILEFDIALYPRGYQSSVPVSVNMAVFLRGEIPEKPVGSVFTYAGTDYTMLQVVPEESDTNSIAVLFE